MARKYDSRRRRKAAERTRERILEAALKLHWQGITAYGPLAREAGCSLPTVRKHFPTKESLYRSCTRRFAESLTPPDLRALESIADPGARVEASISELCRVHEAMLGYAWLSAHQREESPTLDGEMRAYEGLTDAVVSVLRLEDPPRSALVRGLLDFLTYRALRLSGGLAPEEIPKQLIATIRPLILGGRVTPPDESTTDDHEYAERNPHR